MVEFSIGLSNNDGNGITRGVTDDWNCGIRRPKNVASERRVVLEGVRERGFELWNHIGIEERRF